MTAPACGRMTKHDPHGYMEAVDSQADVPPPPVFHECEGFDPAPILDEMVPAGDVVLSEAVDHPDHYGGANDPYEAIKVIRAWRLGFNLGNTVKYIARAGKKDPTKYLEDLKKALWYLNDEVEALEAQS